MSEPYTGEIRMFGGTYAPVHWAFCDGQLITVSENAALFSLLGSTYGGDGRTNFALPEMRGRVPMHYGQGPGLTNRPLGQREGLESVSLTEDQFPHHTHTIRVSQNPATTTTFSGMVLAKQYIYEDFPGALDTGPMHDSTISEVGQGHVHENMMPFLCVSFIICLAGVFPSRS